MSPFAIRVEGLHKEYAVEGEQAGTLYDLLGGLLGASKQDERTAQPTTRFQALRDVGFELKAGEVAGVIGRNGAGKSTLLKILSRITAPTRGRIEVRGRLASLLEVGTGFHPELSGRENIFLNGAILGMKRAEVTRKFDEIVDFAEVEQVRGYTGQALFQRNVCSPRVRRGRAPGNRRAAGRRGSRGRGCVLPAQVPRQDGRRGQGRQNRAVRQPQPCRHQESVLPRPAVRGWPPCLRRRGGGRTRPLREIVQHRRGARQRCAVRRAAGAVHADQPIPVHAGRRACGDPGSYARASDGGARDRPAGHSRAGPQSQLVPRWTACQLMP